MPPIRVGLLVDDERLPAWKAACVRSVGHQGAEIVSAFYIPGGRAPTGTSRFIARDMDKHAPPPEDDPLHPVPVASLTTVVRDTVTIAAGALDLLLDLRASGSPRRDLATIPHLGVWRHEFNDADGSRPVGLAEVADDHPLVRISLVRIGEMPGSDLVLDCALGATNRYSVRKTLNEQLWKAAHLAPRALARAAVGAPPIARTAHACGGMESPARIPATTAARLLARRLGARARATAYDEQWMMAYHLTSAPAAESDRVLDVLHGEIGDLRVMLPPRDRYWADPFPFVHAGRHFLFFEEVLRVTNRGTIAVVEVRDDGSHDEPRVVLDRPYHLSYPFVFAWGGETWMIPESSANGTVELYRATRFPDEWDLDRVLLDGVLACDATLFETDGRWWMAVTIALPPGVAYWDELHLYHAPSPLGPWEPHRDNPVKSDVRSSRPAGRVVATPEGLLRPAQDCSRGYGYAISLQRIDRLDVEGFAEHEIARLEPTWRRGLVGTHTVNAAGRLVAIDGNLLRARYW